jgi:DNA modification methylase
MNRLHNMDCMEGMRLLPDGCVHCCITSPPYFGLRDYGIDGQIGLEDMPEEYISRLVEVFRVVRRVLRDDGTLWLNLGDSYSGSGKGSATHPDDAKKCKQGTNRGVVGYKKIAEVHYDREPKNLLGIPWRVAFALQTDGWYLRSDIIWHKLNPMPESVKDRPTKSHEYIFLLSKSRKYYYDADAIAEPVSDSTIERVSQDVENQAGSDRVPGKTNGNMKAVINLRYGGKKYTESPEQFHLTKSGNLYDYRPRRNKRTVWSIATQPFKEAHFAVFPEKLIEPCVLAGCPAGGVVLDPFMGSGTTAKVALENGRKYIGFELNPDYVKIAEKRLYGTAIPLPLETV